MPKSQPSMYFEPEKGVVHCDGVGGNDFTLCGFSLDGDQGEIRQVIGPGVKIDCPECLAIISFCNSVPKRATA